MATATPPSNYKNLRAKRNWATVFDNGIVGVLAVLA
jgi:hypothetical protein